MGNYQDHLPNNLSTSTKGENEEDTVYILGSTHYSLKRHQKTLNVKREKTSVRHSWETYAYDSQHWEQVSKAEAGS